jgi:spore maturation protein CgeB
MACGRVCFQYVCPEVFEGSDISFLKDGENIVFWRDYQELNDKIKFYRTNNSLCEKIQKKARQTALNYNSTDVVCTKFVEEINRRVGCTV